MFTKKLPCEECVALAACKHRLYVDCDSLYNWLTVVNKREEGLIKKSHLKRITKIFPEKDRIFFGTPSGLPGTNRVVLMNSRKYGGEIDTITTAFKLIPPNYTRTLTGWVAGGKMYKVDDETTGELNTFLDIIQKL